MQQGQSSAFQIMTPRVLIIINLLLLVPLCLLLSDSIVTRLQSISIDDEVEIALHKCISKLLFHDSMYDNQPAAADQNSCAATAGC